MIENLGEGRRAGAGLVLGREGKAVKVTGLWLKLLLDDHADSTDMLVACIPIYAGTERFSRRVKDLGGCGQEDTYTTFVLTYNKDEICVEPKC